MRMPIEVLFEEWINNKDELSPEYHKLLNSKALDALDFDEYGFIEDTVDIEKERAFKAGFRAAVQLFVNTSE